MPRTEIGIADSLGSKALHQGADDGVASRIPSGRNDGDCLMLLGHLVKRTAEVDNLRMNVKAVHRIDAQRQALLGMLLDAAGRCCQNSHIHIGKFLNALHYRIGFQLCRLVFCTMTTDDACNLKIGSHLQCFQRKMSDISISDNGSSNLFHFSFLITIFY